MFKRVLWSFIVFLIASAGVFAVISTYPKQYDFSLDGLLYQLGEQNRDTVKPVTVQIKGETRKKLNGMKSFKGTIDISGENIPVPEKYREINRSFDMQGGALLAYAYSDGGQIKHFLYGTMYVNDDFSKVTITKLVDEDGESKVWTGDDGFMITAPAQSKDEALSITNELMKHVLLGFTLK
ncbi:hypothetical protein [Paenibacillus thermotolerans]|uniref:hypothetical protein n=1 Tax=Paenibacillus thermotolerans TaxID=3027807 RepID=UPI002368A5EB|nr:MULTISPECIES: hypothetical protein [unclassified Paenibacillus]